MYYLNISKNMQNHKKQHQYLNIELEKRGSVGDVGTNRLLDINANLSQIFTLCDRSKLNVNMNY